MMQSKKFSISFFLTSLILFVLVVGILNILNIYSEHNSYEEIVKKQISSDAIYGSALNENYFLYRLEQIRQKQPKIIAIGSSRAGQFRQKFFNTSFVAATNGANSLAEMDYFIDTMLEFYHPQLILLILDPWWFNPNYPNYRTMPYQNINGLNISFEKIFNAITLIPKVFFQKKSNPEIKFKAMGIRALLTSNGSFQDGSVFYASTLVSKTKSKKDLEPETSSGRFYEGNEVDQSRINELEKIILKLSQNKISCLLIIPPLAPYTINILKNSQKYGYLNQLESIIKQYHGYIFLNNTNINTNDCEFYDAIHPGDVVYAKILLSLKNNSKIRKFLNLKNLQTTVNKYRGYAYSDNFFLTTKEQDFLNLGCKK